MSEFNVSSLTDIIFLLLIFFMLTSGVVSPNALNLQLPGNSSVPSNTTSKTDEVRIQTDGNFYLNGRATSLLLLEDEFRTRAGNDPHTFSFVIAPDPGGGGEEPPPGGGECPLGDPALCEIFCGIMPDAPWCAAN